MENTLAIMRNLCVAENTRKNNDIGVGMGQATDPTQLTRVALSMEQPSLICIGHIKFFI